MQSVTPTELTLLQDVVHQECYTDGCSSQGYVSLTRDKYLAYFGPGYGL